MDQSRLCLFCCCAFTQTNFKRASQGIAANRHFTIFCKELDCVLDRKKQTGKRVSNKWKEREKFILNGDLNLDYGKVSICRDCLRHVSATTEVSVEMKKVEETVTNLQKQLLAALKELKPLVDQLRDKMKSIEEIMKASDEPCLHTYIDEQLSARRAQEIINFRGKILNDLPNLQQRLEDKTHCDTVMKRLEDERLRNKIALATSNSRNRARTNCKADHSDVNTNDVSFDCGIEDTLNDGDFEEFHIDLDDNERSSLLPSHRTTRSGRPFVSFADRIPGASDPDFDVEDEDDDASDAASNFSEVDQEFQELKKKEKRYREKIDYVGMSEYKNKIVHRLLLKLERESQSAVPAESVTVTGKIVPDPRKDYPVLFNNETMQLTVHGIEIIVDGDENFAKCSLCDYFVTDAEAKDSHKAAIESVLQDHILGNHICAYKCQFCDKLLPTYRKYSKHMMLHRDKVCDCDICGRPFKDDYEKLRHKWTHMNDEEKEEAKKNGVKGCAANPYTKVKNLPRNFPCPTCGKAFVSRYLLNKHEEVHDEQRKRIMCPDCGKMLLPKGMAYHEQAGCVNRVPNPNEVHECHVCLRRFKSKTTRRRHFKLYHSAESSEQQFPCPICGKTFKFKVNLRNHQIVHSDSRPFVCGGCSASFKIKKNLQRHQKTCKVSSDTATDVKAELFNNVDPAAYLS